MDQKQRRRALALAGVVQAAHLVQGLARKGVIDEPAMQAMADSLFADATEAAQGLFADTARLERGLRLAHRLLRGEAVEHGKELLSYVVQILALERKLAKKPALLAELARGMQRAGQQQQYFSSIHPTVLAQLAELYGQTLSRLLPRIIVRGHPEYLGKEAIQHKVRTLLLAGVRAAHQFRKNGGGHWQVLLARKQLATDMEQLIAQGGPG